MTSGEILAALGLLLAGGGIAGLINALVARRKSSSDIEKTEAETADILVKAAGQAVMLVKAELEKQIQTLKNENASLRCEMDSLRGENVALRAVQLEHETKIQELEKICESFDEVLGGAHVLYEQVKEMNGEPKYKPPERRKKG